MYRFDSLGSGGGIVYTAIADEGPSIHPFGTGVQLAQYHRTSGLYTRPGLNHYLYPPRPFPTTKTTMSSYPKSRRSFSARIKLQALHYWATPSIPYEWDPRELRRPTIREVSEFFGGIPVGCISAWRKIEAQIAEAAAKEGTTPAKMDPGKTRRQVTCSRCERQGHNRSNKNCPWLVDE